MAFYQADPITLITHHTWQDYLPDYQAAEEDLYRTWHDRFAVSMISIIEL